MLRRLVSALPLCACIAVGSALVASVREPLVERYEQPNEHEQMSFLLSPRWSAVFSLGHREALADYLFGTLLVRYGMSFRDKHRDEAAFRYLDTITTLAPTFSRPYRYADTLLTMLPSTPTTQDYLDTRYLHERGEKALPTDQELWYVAGQFATYIAPDRLPQPLADEFKQKGVADLARACELASNNANIPYGCIAVLRQFNKEGQREALIRMLTRTLAVNDDPEIRRIATTVLQRQLGEREKARYTRRMKELEGIWQEQMPQVSRVMMSLLGPGPDVWKCAGRSAAVSAECATSWREWGEARDRSGS
jgi:hypothetical protein